MSIEQLSQLEKIGQRIAFAFLALGLLKIMGVFDAGLPRAAIIAGMVFFWGVREYAALMKRRRLNG